MKGLSQWGSGWERERDVKRENKVGRVRETDCDKNEATRLSAIRVWNILYFEV